MRYNSQHISQGEGKNKLRPKRGIQVKYLKGKKSICQYIWTTEASKAGKVNLLINVIFKRKTHLPTVRRKPRFHRFLSSLQTNATHTNCMHKAKQTCRHPCDSNKVKNKNTHTTHTQKCSIGQTCVGKLHHTRGILVNIKVNILIIGSWSTPN